MTKNPTDTNQASEDAVNSLAARFANTIGSPRGEGVSYEPEREELARKEYFNELGNYSHFSDGDWQSFTKDLSREIQALIRTEKLKLLAELDKSMPTAEQLTTKYGYHMPDKQYGYKLALHDIREVLAKLEAEL